MTIKNGDIPAMPMFSYEAKPGVIRDTETNDVGHSSGLTKREAMAMAAMQGLLSKHGDDDYDRHNIAKYSVEHADALLEELVRTSANK